MKSFPSDGTELCSDDVTFVAFEAVTVGGVERRSELIEDVDNVAVCGGGDVVVEPGNVDVDDL